MQFTWESLIDRARVYVDDDHLTTGEQGWIAPASWLTLGNVEYSQQYRKWKRMGLVSPQPIDIPLNASSTTIPNVLATIGIGEDLGGGRIRVIKPRQPKHGVDAIRNEQYSQGLHAVYWEAFAVGDTTTYVLSPPREGKYARGVLTAPNVAQTTQSIQLLAVPDLNTVFRARSFGAFGNGITVQLIDDAAGVPFLSDGSQLELHYDDTHVPAPTIGDLEALLAGSAVVEVETPCPTPDRLMTAADATTIQLAGGLDATAPTGNYFVRLLQAPAYATDITETIDIPYGCDERLVLGMARRSHLKDASASALLERLIAEADADVNFASFSRLGESPRVRRQENRGHHHMWPGDFASVGRFV